MTTSSLKITTTRRDMVAIANAYDPQTPEIAALVANLEAAGLFADATSAEVDAMADALDAADELAA